jgi:hypothetical protein
MDATEAAVHFARALQAAKIPHAIGGAIARAQRQLTSGRPAP